MGKLVWINGDLIDADKAAFNVYDHGLLYGDGVFEGIRCYDGRIFKLDSHLNRLFDGINALRITDLHQAGKFPYTKVELAAAIRETVARNADCRPEYIRVIVTRGIGDLGLNPKSCAKPSVAIIADSLTMYNMDQSNDEVKTIKAIISSVRRNSIDALPPQIKSLNYLNNILAKMEAVDRGVDEAIMLNSDGYVVECTGDNLFLVVADGTILTSPMHAGLLPGITAGVVQSDLVPKLGLRCKERLLTLADLYCAREVFVTGTAAEIAAVSHIDCRMVNNGEAGKVTVDLYRAFQQLVRSDAPED